jgi:hypothetical protein
MLNIGEGVGKVANAPKNDDLIQIEETQAALRESIEKAKALVEESDRRVRRQRGDAEPPPIAQPQPN